MESTVASVALAALLAGCSPGASSNSGSSLLSSAAAQTSATHAAAVDCFKTFDACLKAATSSDAVKACRDALGACLPTQTGVTPPGAPDVCSAPPDGGLPPPPPGPGMGGPGMGGGGPGCDGAPDGGLPPPPPDGPGLPPPPPGAPPPPPLSPTGRADLAVCQVDLKLCLEASSDPQSCLQTAHQCVHDALTADFKLVCAALEQACSACASSPICVDIGTRCAAGPPFPDSAK